jgi:NAD(P)-dependent dehydrogenase (short-subunit alcohol dehydrogenase family)
VWEPLKGKEVVAMRLKDRVAIITGVSGEGQVGQAVAQAFAREGAKLVLVARRAEAVNARAEEVRALGAEVLAIAADLTVESEVQRVVQQALERFGRIDILVNLAGGLTRYKGVTEHTLEDWNSELNNNLLTAFLCSRAVFEPMKAAGGGRIINFARAGDPQAKMVAYNCAKAGVAALTRTFALEGRKHNIRVNAVAPGIVDTKSNVEAMQPKPEDLARWTKREEIAATVVFLASDESSGITGQVIPVTGRLL